MKVSGTQTPHLHDDATLGLSTCEFPSWRKDIDALQTLRAYMRGNHEHTGSRHPTIPKSDSSTVRMFAAEYTWVLYESHTHTQTHRLTQAVYRSGVQNQPLHRSKECSNEFESCLLQPNSDQMSRTKSKSSCARAAATPNAEISQGPFRYLQTKSKEQVITHLLSNVLPTKIRNPILIFSTGFAAMWWTLIFCVRQMR